MAEIEQQELTGPDYYYTNFIGSHVKGSKPVSKSFENNNGKVSYNEVPLTYNYGTEESPIIDSCFFECPEVSSFGGINIKTETKPPRNEGDPPYVKKSYSIMFSFDLQDPECVACLEKLDQLHVGTAQALEKYKGDLSMFSFKAEHPGELFKHPVYYKMDPATCERIKGRNPSVWVKLNDWKTNKTLFTDLAGNKVDWALLEDVELKLVPLLHIEKIYVGGGKASLQVKLVSAVITDIIPINTKTRQTRTLDRLKAKAGLADSVAAQLAELRMAKQDTLDDGDFQPQNANAPEDGQMHHIPTGGSNFQGTQDNLTSFLGGAPAVNPSPPIQHQQVSQVQQVPQVQLQQQVPQQQAPQLVQQQVPAPQVQFNPSSQQGVPQTVQLQIS